MENFPTVAFLCNDLKNSWNKYDLGNGKHEKPSISSKLPLVHEQIGIPNFYLGKFSPSHFILSLYDSFINCKIKQIT